MRIDWWTLGIQAVNVLILVWLLGHFFWRPLAAIIAARRVAAAKLIDEATAQRKEAAAALVAIGETRAGFTGEREAILQAARKDAEQARAALLDEAKHEAETLVTQAREAMRQEAQTAKSAWEAQANLLAVDVARRLAGRLVGSAVQAAFEAWLLEDLRALSDKARAAAGTATLELSSAAPLAEADQARLRAALAEALGGTPQLTFRTEPELIAGLELHGPDLIVRNSWRADLDAIHTELADVG